MLADPDKISVLDMPFLNFCLLIGFEACKDFSVLCCISSSNCLLSLQESISSLFPYIMQILRLFKYTACSKDTKTEAWMMSEFEMSAR